MIVRCEACAWYYDDEYRWTYCPHTTFPANDGFNRMQEHPESYRSANAPGVPPWETRYEPVSRWQWVKWWLLTRPRTVYWRYQFSRVLGPVIARKRPR